MTFNQVVRGSNPRTLTIDKDADFSNEKFAFFIQKYKRNCRWQILLYTDLYADVAELADALDLGSSVHDVQVQVLLSAFAETLPVAGSVFFDIKVCKFTV